MTRRAVLALLIVAALGAGATGALVFAGDREEPTPVPDEARAVGLTLLVVRTAGGPFAAVVGSTGGADAALVVPAEVQVTIPGQGEATLADALELPPRQGATTVANLLGVWVEHYAVLGPERLAQVVDRAGGISVGEAVLSGDQALAMLEEAGEGGTSAFTLVLGGLLRASPAWEPPDFTKADSPSSVLRTFESAAGAPASFLPVVEAATDVFQADGESVRTALVEAFGGPTREVVGVIVLNGSGVPGIGELVAERLVPGGFRIVISDNASDFDHEETLVVVGSADVALGERVRDLLGTGSVNVSVSSGIAPVTVVIGEDFGG
ncbi:MAG: LCP family protein [Actinomycetota bacterium]